jgi:hypothetical protein
MAARKNKNGKKREFQVFSSKLAQKGVQVDEVIRRWNQRKLSLRQSNIGTTRRKSKRQKRRNNNNFSGRPREGTRRGKKVFVNGRWKPISSLNRNERWAVNELDNPEARAYAQKEQRDFKNYISKSHVEQKNLLDPTGWNWNKIFDVAKDVAPYIIEFFGDSDSASRGLKTNHPGVAKAHATQSMAYAYGTTSTNRGMHFSGGKAELTVSGEDFLGKIVTDTDNYAAGNLLYSADLNPYRLFGTRLSQFAPLFENFKILQLYLLYRPSCAVTETGSFICYFDRDPDEYIEAGGDAAVRQASAHMGAITFPCWKPAVAHFNGSIGDRAKLWYCDLTSGDDRMVAQGRINFMVSEDASASTSYGTINLVYKVRYVYPQLESTSTGNSVTIIGSGSMTAARPFGTPVVSELYDDQHLVHVPCTIAWTENAGDTNNQFCFPAGWFSADLEITGTNITVLGTVMNGGYDWLRNNGDTADESTYTINAGATEVVYRTAFYSTGIDETFAENFQVSVTADTVTAAALNIARMSGAPPRNTSYVTLSKEVEHLREKVEKIETKFNPPIEVPSPHKEVVKQCDCVFCLERKKTS